MKWLSAGLTFVNFCTVTGLILGIIAGGLSTGIAGTCLILGIVAAILAYFERSTAAKRRNHLCHGTSMGAFGCG